MTNLMDNLYKYYPTTLNSRLLIFVFLIFSFSKIKSATQRAQSSCFQHFRKQWNVVPHPHFRLSGHFPNPLEPRFHLGAIALTGIKKAGYLHLVSTLKIIRTNANDFSDARHVPASVFS